MEIYCPICDGDVLLCEQQAAKAAACPQCGGCVVSHEELQELCEHDLKAAPEAEVQRSVECVYCRTPMVTISLDGIEVDFCRKCAQVWLDGGEIGKLAEADESPRELSLGRMTLFALSMPERAVRSLVASAGGLVKESTDFVIPDKIKGTKLYTILVGKLLRFMVENVGEVEGVFEGDEEADPNFAAKKIVGNFVEFAGIATLHVSPLWVLAVFSDVSSGARTYLDALVAELKAQNVISGDAEISSAQELLATLEAVSATMADNVDTPPLNMTELRQSYSSIVSDARGLTAAKDLTVDNARAVWSTMVETATKERKSLFEISTVATMAAINAVTKTAKGTLVGAKVTASLLNDAIIAHYSESISEIHKNGYYKTLLDTYQPYAAAVYRQFDPSKDTLTSRFLSGQIFRDWFQKARAKGARDTQARKQIGDAHDEAMG